VDASELRLLRATRTLSTLQVVVAPAAKDANRIPKSIDGFLGKRMLDCGLSVSVPCKVTMYKHKEIYICEVHYCYINIFSSS
jgi:hypothetical protein